MQTHGSIYGTALCGNFENQQQKQIAGIFACNTFDAAGWNDAPCWSSIASRDNAGFIQVGSRHHHLLQILIEL